MENNQPSVEGETGSQFFEESTQECKQLHEKDKDKEADDTKTAADSKEAQQSIQRCIQMLVHARQCRNTNCLTPSCRKMTLVIRHSKNCRRKTKRDCPICKNLITLCGYHAKRCCETKCLVPFCSQIKQQIKLLDHLMAATKARAQGQSGALASPIASQSSSPQSNSSENVLDSPTLLPDELQQ